MIEIKEIDSDLLNKLFDSNIVPRIVLDNTEKYMNEYSTPEKSEIEKLISQKHTVLGMDIYRYSEFDTNQQMFIPHLFDRIYQESWRLIKQNFTFLFQNYGNILDSDRRKFIQQDEYFINTGDGGFQIFETPIHAIIFVITFATILRFYNSDRFIRKMYSKIGNVEIRYAITMDDIYRYNDNFYGAAIINNSRMLSKDKLNRFLLDSNSYNWFLDQIYGIENLMTLGLNDISKLNEFDEYHTEEIENGHNALITKSIAQGFEGIKAVDVQRIGKIRQKTTLLDIYNIHLQATIQYKNLFAGEALITVSIGNLNISGIENEET